MLRGAEPTPNSGDRLAFSRAYDLLHFGWNAYYSGLFSLQVARFGAAQALGDAPEICSKEGGPMGAVRARKGVDRSLELIVKRLHDEGEHVVHEGLPRRWVDLIHCLNEQERKNYDRSPAEDVAEAELADATQEKALQELVRTDEPTEEASKLLETLRRKVAHAISKR